MSFEFAIAGRVDPDGSRLAPVNATHERLVNLGVHEHVLEIGNLHQLLVFSYRLALSDQLLPTDTPPSLFRGEIYHQAVLRSGQAAFFDLVHDVVVLVDTLLPNPLLGVTIGLRLHFLGMSLLNGP